MFRRQKEQSSAEVAWTSALTPTAFIDALIELRDSAYKGSPPQEDEQLREFEFARDDARLDEARNVAEVALAFAKSEIRPRDRGLGIPPGPNFVHALGHQLQKELRGASGAQFDAAAAAVLGVLAYGYLRFVAIEPAAPASLGTFVDATPDHIWAVTVGNFRRDALLAAGLPPEAVKAWEEGAATRLLLALQNSGILMRQVRTLKIQELAHYYVNAGALLRIAQLNWTLSAPLRTVQAAAFAQFWPYSAYVPA